MAVADCHDTFIIGLRIIPSRQVKCLILLNECGCCFYVPNGSLINFDMVVMLGVSSDGDECYKEQGKLHIHIIIIIRSHGMYKSILLINHLQ